MRTIGLFSDTHGYLDRNLFEHFRSCDEIWHAGDFGDMQLVEEMQNGFEGKIIRGVYGNIDDKNIRNIFPERVLFPCENISILMQHIGGYPGKYAPGIKDVISVSKPAIFISGHSHILKIQYDQSHSCLHMNPGAAGKQGWHKMRTAIRFKVDGSEIKDCEIIELGSRG